MNFKEWNIKKGLKRIWIVGSVLVPFILMATGYVCDMGAKSQRKGGQSQIALALAIARF